MKLFAWGPRRKEDICYLGTDRKADRGMTAGPRRSGGYYMDGDDSVKALPQVNLSIERPLGL